MNSRNFYTVLMKYPIIHKFFFLTERYYRNIIHIEVSSLRPSHSSLYFSLGDICRYILTLCHLPYAGQVTSIPLNYTVGEKRIELIREQR